MPGHTASEHKGLLLCAWKAMLLQTPCLATAAGVHKKLGRGVVEGWQRQNTLTCLGSMLSFISCFPSNFCTIQLRVSNGGAWQGHSMDETHAFLYHRQLRMRAQCGRCMHAWWRLA